MQFIDLAAQQARIKDKIKSRVGAVLDHGKYIMGPEVKEFEAGLRDFCGAKHALGCANGTDALLLALMAFGVRSGDAIFCPSFTFAATAEVAPCMGAVPVFVEVDPITFNMDVESLKRSIIHARELGLKPAVVMPVDLFGLPADYDAIEEIAREEELKIIADSAQAFGANYKGRITGSIGDIATTSFFPAKPLGCYGDGGAVFTNNDEYAMLLDSYRVHGKGSDKYDNIRIGLNSRLDTIQAAILLEKLAIYTDEIDRRQGVAQRYADGLGDLVDTPVVPENYVSVWAQYTVKMREGQDRNAVQAALQNAGVPSVVYYPMPLHRQSAYRDFPTDPIGLAGSEVLSQQVLSLPMHPYLDAATQDKAMSALRAALGR